ncbi:hypothetical protein JW796_02740 [Candidatus Dojkabacteria bacterium]|nr:hypothetical protein [Candidatus Dojkabacteria bacterium]
MSDKRNSPMDIVNELERLYGTKEHPKVSAVENVRELMNSGVEALTIEGLDKEKYLVPEAVGGDERLIDPNFEITQDLFKQRVREACHEVYPGYPPLDARLKLSKKDAHDLSERAKTGELSIQAIHNGTNACYEHPNRDSGNVYFEFEM